MSSTASIWDRAVDVSFERGVSIEKVQDGSWRLGSDSTSQIDTPETIQKNYALRPIYATFLNKPSDTTYKIVFPATAGKALSIRLSELLQFIYSKKTGELFLSTQSLFFLLRAINYHCEQLASVYASSVKLFAKFPFLRGDSNKVVTQHFEIYYEFDSLTTAVIRALDSIRYFLWWAQGGTGSLPNSFIRTVNALASLSSEQRTELEGRWHSNFLHAKEYRDCIQHYVAAGSKSFSMHYQIDGSVWAMYSHIPDNPEARSARAFEYKNKFDALTYSWELSSNVYDLIEYIFGMGLPENESDSKQV